MDVIFNDPLGVGHKLITRDGIFCRPQSLTFRVSSRYYPTNLRLFQARVALNFNLNLPFSTLVRRDGTYEQVTTAPFCA